MTVDIQSLNLLVLACSDHSGGTVLIERGNGLLKTHIQSKVGSSSLDDWGKVLQKAVYTLSKCPKHSTIYLIARIHGSRNLGVEKGIFYSLSPL